MKTTADLKTDLERLRAQFNDLFQNLGLAVERLREYRELPAEGLEQDIVSARQQFKAMSSTLEELASNYGMTRISSEDDIVSLQQIEERFIQIEGIEKKFSELNAFREQAERILIDIPGAYKF